MHSLCILMNGVYNMNCCACCVICVLGEEHIGKSVEPNKCVEEICFFLL